MRVSFIRPDSDVPSGGNVFDDRVCAGLRGLGVDVRELAIAGDWPVPGDRPGLTERLANIPDGDIVLLDGLVACGNPDIIAESATRLRTAILVHLPLAEESGPRLDAVEREALHAVDLVIATSPHAARDIARRHGISTVRTVIPGTDPAPLAQATGSSRLLCVAAVSPRKGQDLLVEALARLRELSWTCTLIGPLRDREFAAHLAALIETRGLGGRIRLHGPVDRPDYAADLLVQPSRAETYGMAVTEALARGIPVMASAVPDALDDGGLPLPPGDVDALTSGLRRWLTDEALRARLRQAACRRRDRLPTWDDAAQQLAAALANLEA